jgi:hypothetical protein
MEDILHVTRDAPTKQASRLVGDIGFTASQVTAPQSLYTLHVSDMWGPDATPILYDILRMLCIQTSIQGMLALSHPSHTFLTSEFGAILLYIVLGVLFYWLVIRRTFTFT